MIPWWWTEMGEAERARLMDAFSRRRFSMGEVTEELEARLAQFLHVPYVVVTPSGTAALTLALMALGVGPGDEVICPDLTWIATAQAAHILGARVVAVDSLPDMPMMDVTRVEKCLSSKTRAIIPVHYNGRRCDMAALKALRLPIIEDACKALGSSYYGAFLGTEGSIGCFSLGLVSLVTAGYGGAAITDDYDHIAMMRFARDHGIMRNYGEEELYLTRGYNFKVSDLLAAVALGQMDGIEARRQALVSLYYRYEAGLQDLQNVRLIPVDVQSGAIPLLIDAISPRAGELRRYLHDHGVETAPFHPPIDTAHYLNIEGDFPNATRFWRQGFNLPSGPGQKPQDIDRTIELIKEWDYGA